MKKTITLGKIDYLNNGKRNCLVEIEINFNGTNFSASGTIWNHLKTNCYSVGQNLDTIKKFLPNNKLFNKIYMIWKKYHLNNLTAGSPKQMQFLNCQAKPQDIDHYDWACEQLKSIDLYYDKSYLYEGKPYKYGSAWLTTLIPTEIKKEINQIINN